ncbi:MAG: ring-opening amidohydrolase [Hyphomicrobiaceae bacterium]
MQPVEIHRLPMAHPADLRSLEMLIDGGLPVASIRAIWCKTAGTGLLNDYSRDYAELAITQLLHHRQAAPGSDAARIQIVVSGGCEGIVAPHLLVLADARGVPNGTCGLVAGWETEIIDRAAAGTPEHAHTTAAMVRRAAAAAGLAAPGDVALAIVRAPVEEMTAPRVRAARLAAAAGVGLATGYLPELPPDLAAGFDGPPNIFAVARADDSAQQVVVLGNGRGARSPQQIACGALADALDSPAVAGLLDRLGIAARPQAAPRDAARIRGVFIKGDAPAQRLRGWLHTMHDDPTLPMHRQSRAAYAAMVGSVTGQSALFVSGGAEGHGPRDGGLLIVIAQSPPPQEDVKP